MRDPFSQTEQGLRDTLIHKAEGLAFDRLADLYGIPRVQVIQRKYWRKLLLAAAMGPRDVFGTIWAVLEAMFDQWAEPLTSFDVTWSPADPNKISALAPWTCAHVGRYVRIEGEGVFWSVGYSGVDLELATIRTSQWKGAAWTSSGASTAKLLPWWIEDYGAVVYVGIDAELFGAPPTYLQPNGVDPRPTGQPIGGQIVESPVISNAGRFPLYLPGEEIRGLLQVVLDRLCAAGVRVSLRAVEGCPGNGLGLGSLADLLSLGRVGTPGAYTPPTGWS